MSRRRTTERLSPWIAAAASGALFFLGYAGFGRFYLEWFFLVPLLWAIREAGPGRAFRLGWVAGAVGYAGGFYWIVQMFEEFAGLALPLAAAGLVLLAVANGLLFALWAWATRILTRGAGWSAAWGAPVAWVAAETLWPQLFPNYLGASQYKLLWLTQVADLTGIFGVTFLVAYANSTAYAVLDRRLSKQAFAWRPVLVFVVVLGLALGYGAVRVRGIDGQVAAADALTVGVIQTNRGAGDKRGDPEVFLREHQEMSRALTARRRVDLVVWPEAVCGLDLFDRGDRVPPDVPDEVHAPLLFGAVLREGGDGDRRVYNAAVLADAEGSVLGTYAKAVLLPLGEYIPLGDRFPRLYSWSPNTGRFWPGSSGEPLVLKGHPLGVSICYEDLFPGYIRTLMRGGRDHRVPEALVNLTNDSWYGDSAEPLEHLALASFRAIEHRRALVRATNTGVSAIVDPVGRLGHRSGQWTRETLVGQVPLLHGCTVYGVVGNWFGTGCAVITLLGLGQAYLVARRRAERAKAPGGGRKKRR